MEKMLSVIVPVYNVEQYLPKCLDSILGQEYAPMEVLLVDDGSKDSSGRICDQYAQRDDRIRVIHKENGGLSSARNAGLDQARGEYLSFVDSDDFLEPDAYRTMIDLMERSEADLVCGGRYDVDVQTGEKRVGLCPEKQESIPGWEFAGRIFQWEGCDSAAWDKLYRRKLFNSLRYPVGKISEDMPVTYRAALASEKVAMLNKPIYNYIHRPGSITQSAISEGFFDQERHTAAIYEDICKNAPQIAPQARYLRVWCLSLVMIRILRADEASRRRFWPRYRNARRELGKHTLFFLTYSRFSTLERVRNLLLALGLYSVLRPLFTKDTRKNS